MTECCIDYKINMSQQGDDCQNIKEKNLAWICIYLGLQMKEIIL